LQRVVAFASQEITQTKALPDQRS
jgi:hypothetical protein